MSHFALTVALPAHVPAGEDALRRAVAERLAPFDATREVERYREYTRDELIAKGRAEIEEYRVTTYAHFLADPDGYLAKYFTVAHHAYLRDEFPQRLGWSDDQVYRHAIRHYEPDDIGADGEVYSTRNKDGRWDWWVIGGRWSGQWTLAVEVDYPRLMSEGGGAGPGAAWPSTNCGRVGDITPDSHDPSMAHIDAAGRWHDTSPPGWVVPDDPNDSRRCQYERWIDSLDPQTWLVKVDCHT